MPRPPPELRRGRGLSNRASGDLGEELARRYLTGKGYESAESNYRPRRGELDLISRRADTLVKGDSSGTPIAHMCLKRDG